MSRGFNPHPHFSVLSPLPVGIEGTDEVLELDLTESVPPRELTEALAAVLPTGLTIFRVEQVDSSRRARVRSVRYHFRGFVAASAVDRCMAQTSILVTRRDGKGIDIRPYLQDIRRSDSGCDVEVLVTNEGTVRPAEIAAILFPDGCACRVPIVRTAVNIKEDQRASPNRTV